MAFQWTTDEYTYYNTLHEEFSTPGSQYIFIGYADMNVEINHEVLMVDANTFVSNIGGNMIYTRLLKTFTILLNSGILINQLLTTIF